MMRFANRLMAVKVNDFIELDYTGRLKETHEVFDTTNTEEAQKAGVHNPHAHYKPVIICLGRGQLLKGLEQQLVGKEIGTHEFTLSQEQAFGRKDAKLLKLVPTKVFLRQGIRPMPGLQVNIDDGLGTIRTVTGGRTVVDFNHPLSGHEVEYTVTIKRIVTDKKEQVAAILDCEYHLHDADIFLSEKKAVITVKQLPPEPAMRHLSSVIQEATEIDATFEAKTAPVPPTANAEKVEQ